MRSGRRGFCLYLICTIVGITPVLAASGVGWNPAKLPLAFEANTGAWEDNVRFAAHGTGGLMLFETGGGVQFRAPGAESGPVRQELAGAARPQGAGKEPLAGSVNYLLGAPDNWHIGVPTYSKIEFPQVYPGIDLIYYGVQNQLEYDFVISPGSSPRKIRLKFTGVEKMQIERDGDLLLSTRQGIFRHNRPRIYQIRNGQRVEIEGRYVLLRKGHVGFQVGEYDRLETLIIDPVLTYSTTRPLGSDDRAYAMAVDSSGCAYVTGETWTTSGGLSGGGQHAFVTKLNPAGTAALYTAYIGGESRDTGHGIAIDVAGNAYVAGFTYSQNFPTTSGALRRSASQQEAFVLKLNPTGTSLVYSTLLGGSGTDYAAAIAVDSAGQAHVTGYTSSLDFPTTSGALKRSFSGGFYDAFMVKLNAAGNALLYASYLGGSGNDTGAAIALDPAGNIYVAGTTASSDFPTRNPVQSSGGINTDAFVTKLNASGQLFYSTYLGGNGADSGNAIVADATGNAYVAGSTFSLNLPVTAGCYQNQLAGAYDAFAAKLSTAGSIIYATYLGGKDSDTATAIALDTAGNVYIGGNTYSIDFPTRNAVQTGPGGNGDVFFASLDHNGAAVLYSSYLGGSGSDSAAAIALDPPGNIYVAGYTFSANFPVTQPYPATGRGRTFVSKIGNNQALTPAIVSVSPASGEGNYQSFRFEYQHPNGFSNLSLVQVLISDHLSGAGACYILYDRPDNLLILAMDPGSGGYMVPLLKTSPPLGNSQCTINVAGSTVSASGTSLVLTLDIALKSSFAGGKNIYMLAMDQAGQLAGWSIMGSWTVPANTPPIYQCHAAIRQRLAPVVSFDVFGCQWRAGFATGTSACEQRSYRSSRVLCTLRSRKQFCISGHGSRHGSDWAGSAWNRQHT